MLYFRHIGDKAPELDFDDEADDHPFAGRDQAFQSLVLLGLMGDFERSSYPAVGDQIILYLFIGLVNIIFLNVLIAIVSESFDKAMSTAFTLFWKARYEIVREEVATFGFLFLRQWQLSESKVRAIVMEQMVTGDYAKEKEIGRIADIENRVKKNTKAEGKRLERSLMVHLEKYTTSLKAAFTDKIIKMGEQQVDATKVEGLISQHRNLANIVEQMRERQEQIHIMLETIVGALPTDVPSLHAAPPAAPPAASTKISAIVATGDTPDATAQRRAAKQEAKALKKEIGEWVEEFKQSNGREPNLQDRKKEQKDGLYEQFADALARSKKIG